MAATPASPSFSLPRSRAKLSPTRSSFLSQRLPTRLIGSAAFRLQTKRGFRVRTPTIRLRVLCSRNYQAATVTRETWEKLVLNSEVPVLVEFFASWCGPCRMVQRVIDEIAMDYAGKLNCFVLDTDCDSKIAEKYDIKAVPVVLFFKDGEKRDSVVGTMPKEFYVAAIEKILAS